LKSYKLNNKNNNKMQHGRRDKEPRGPKTTIQLC